jgi:hypothetical protein
MPNKYLRDAGLMPLSRDGRPSSTSLTREGGSREPSVGADVLVPFQQAMISGGFGMLVAGPLAAWIWRDPVLCVIGGFAGFVTVAGAAWVMLLLDHRHLLWAMERISHTDLNGDGQVGEVRVEIRHTDATGRTARLEYMNVAGITDEQLRVFARGVMLEGRPLTVAYWTGRGMPFSRGQYDALMSELTRFVIVRDNGHQGRDLTRKGMAVLRGIAEQPPAKNGM